MAIDVVKKPWQIVEFERLVGGADELAIKNTIANIFSTYDDWNYQEKSHWGFTIAQLRLAAEIAEDDAYKDLSLKEVNSELLRAIFSKNIELSIRKQIAAYLKPGIDGYYQRLSNQEPVGDGFHFAVNRAALMALCLVCDFELLPPEKRFVPG